MWTLLRGLGREINALTTVRSLVRESWYYQVLSSGVKPEPELMGFMSTGSDKLTCSRRSGHITPKIIRCLSRCSQLGGRGKYS